MGKRRQEGKSEADGVQPSKKLKKFEKISSKRECNDRDDADSIVVCQIANNKRVTVKNYKGALMVDIREFYYVQGGKTIPGKKGITMPVDQWNILREHFDKIDKHVELKSKQD